MGRPVSESCVSGFDCPAPRDKAPTVGTNSSAIASDAASVTSKVIGR